MPHTRRFPPATSEWIDPDAVGNTRSHSSLGSCHTRMLLWHAGVGNDVWVKGPREGELQRKKEMQTNRDVTFGEQGHTPEKTVLPEGCVAKHRTCTQRGVW